MMPPHYETLHTRSANPLRRGVESTSDRSVPYFIAQTRRGADRQGHEAFFRDMLGDVREPTAPSACSISRAMRGCE